MKFNVEKVKISVTVPADSLKKSEMPFVKLVLE
jgi:hypothetical protein